MKQLNNNFYYFVSNFGIGDTYFLCSLKEVLERKFGSKIIFVIKDSHRAIMECFDISDYIIYDMGGGIYESSK
ncbi:MAG: hypothetical protein K2P17_05225 [Helicobacteraceae bacterium]|nr:hypothetical protein [Helicobacteraceae bacterium]